VAPTTTTVAPTTTTTLPNSLVPNDTSQKEKLVEGIAAIAGMPKDGWVKVDKGETSLTITTSDGLAIKIGAKVKSSVTLRLNTRGMPIFEANDFITIAGSGLKPFTPASTWLFSTPTKLGQLQVDGNGNFSEEYSIGDAVAPGDHTAQLNGIAPDGTLRVVEVAVEIVPTAEEAAARWNRIDPNVAAALAAKARRKAENAGTAGQAPSTPSAPARQSGTIPRGQDEAPARTPEPQVDAAAAELAALVSNRRQAIGIGRQDAYREGWHAERAG
jgi:hypothetical protein